ncbi:MAG: ABC transporter ATP-binding protein [Desulfobacteraceae bacterium]|nr:MAG: ABC transporter ATP-binding protein [Desulfobacteraceae bacterium]
MPLLEIDNLSVIYRAGRGRRRLTAVDQVSLSLDQGRSLGLVGISGSGKTTIGAAIIGLLPKNAIISSGRILFEGADLLKADPETVRRIRWKEISMIFQAAMNALNPIQRVGSQIIECIRVHEPQTSEKEARRRVAELYELLAIPTARIDDFPHQYSGGMRQRAVIAMALACRPKLIIADEPTTALDVIVQDQILRTIGRIQDELKVGILFISHDIAVIADVCHDVGVMHEGRLMEVGQAREVFGSPGHSCTRALLDAHITLTDRETGRSQRTAEPKAGQKQAPLDNKTE